MTTFDERKKAFEAKYQHDQELLFKIGNRRNRLLGLWAGELMGMASKDADAYAREVVISDIDKPGDDDVHDKVYADLREKKIDLSDHRLRKMMDELLHTAHEQIMTETKS